jgi:hypothetical protein
MIALGALVHGSTVLIRETRIVVRVLQERAARVQARAVSRGGTAPAPR